MQKRLSLHTLYLQTALPRQKSHTEWYLLHPHSMLLLTFDSLDMNTPLSLHLDYGVLPVVIA